MGIIFLVFGMGRTIATVHGEGKSPVCQVKLLKFDKIKRTFRRVALEDIEDVIRARRTVMTLRKSHPKLFEAEMGEFKLCRDMFQCSAANSVFT